MGATQFTIVNGCHTIHHALLYMGTLRLVRGAGAWKVKKPLVCYIGLYFVLTMYTYILNLLCVFLPLKLILCQRYSIDFHGDPPAICCWATVLLMRPLSQGPFKNRSLVAA